jgi:hypothetical protein
MADPPSKKAKSLSSIAQFLHDNALYAGKLKEISNTTNIRKVVTEIDGNTGVCYFISDGSIKFRHAGSDAKTPPVFLLENRQSQDSLDGKVLVEYSASGTGKTVDLAGSAASLGLDLTIIVSIQEERNTSSMALLTEKVKEVIEGTPTLKEICALATETVPLKIAFAIDESLVCENLIRSIIHSQADARAAVAAGLGLAPDRLVTRFLVGGTGAVTATIGSNTENYETLDPSALDKAATLCNSFLTKKLSLLLPGDTTQSIVTYSVIQDKLPVLATLMENGRMSSIGASVLNKWESTEPADESAIVSKTIKSYISSNGMKKLLSLPESMRLVAASALAVHLFQWREVDN